MEEVQMHGWTPRAWKRTGSRADAPVWAFKLPEGGGWKREGQDAIGLRTLQSHRMTMKTITLTPHQMITLNDYPIYSPEMLRLYFRQSLGGHYHLFRSSTKPSSAGISPPSFAES
jgi:hypothetical protein